MNTIFKTVFVLLALLFSITTHAQVSIDTVRVGTQVWMAKDLDVTHYRNGDSIPEAKTYEEFNMCSRKKMGCWCYDYYDTCSNKHWRKLYNWYAVNDKRGLAPVGWRVPSKYEYRVLINFLGAYSGEKMKSGPGWDFNCDTSNTDGTICNGTNESKLSFLPGYYRRFNFWWTSSSSDWQTAFCLFLGCGGDAGVLAYKYCIKTWGYPVRCIKGEYIDTSKRKKHGYYH